MPLRLEIKRELSARSERVKCVDVHPSESWVLAALFSGNMVIWSYATETMLKTFEVSDVPVRSAKFVPRKQWVICGSDDMKLRVYNFNTMEKVKTIDAHSDYIRGLAVHPKSPYVLSASDDMSIKLFDWSKDWENTQTFEGHTHYVMQVEFNPKDTNTFASASLDRSVKVWGLSSRTPHFSLEGHERGVNCVSYFSGGDRPYLISGADDHTIKVWDYQTKSCVATLEGHTNNVSTVMFHPVLPLVISGSEDGTVRMWHSTTFRLENTLNYGMERCWSIACDHDTNKVAIGYDEGTIMIKIGHEEPVASMDRNGKVVWAKNHDIIGTNVKTASIEDVSDGERLPLVAKEMGSCEIYPQDMCHDPKARLLAVCGDGEYIIYTALSLKNKSFGPALEFVWGSTSGVYATRESSTRIKVFKNFAEHQTFRPDFSVEGIYGGHLLALRSSDFVDFVDWDTCAIVRRIEVCPRLIFWSESGDVAVVAAESSFYVLSFNSELVSKYLAQNIDSGEQGIESAFELEKEIGEVVVTGQFVGDCFIYTNNANRLNYCVGGEVVTLAHLSKPFYLLGFLPRENRVYLIDKQHNIVSFQLLVNVLVYETAIVRRDLDAAAEVFPSIPEEYRDKLARFLEGQGLKEEALKVTTDPEHKFELAIQLNKLDLAKQLSKADDSDVKWKQVGDTALADFDLQTARQCFEKANDFGSILLLTTSLGDRDGVERLARLATKAGRLNIAFMCHFLCGHVEKCLDLLVSCGRHSEAAIMARAYAPSHVPRLVEIWRRALSDDSVALAESLADPLRNDSMFPGFENFLKAETFLKRDHSKVRSADDYEAFKKSLDSDVLQAAHEGQLGNVAPATFVPIDHQTTITHEGDERRESVFDNRSESSDDEVPVPPAAAAKVPSPRPVAMEQRSEPIAEPEEQWSEPVAVQEERWSEPIAEPEERWSEPFAEPEERWSEPVAEPEERWSEPVAEPEEHPSEPAPQQRIQSQDDDPFGFESAPLRISPQASPPAQGDLLRFEQFTPESHPEDSAPAQPAAMADAFADLMSHDVSPVASGIGASSHAASGQPEEAAKATSASDLLGFDSLGGVYDESQPLEPLVERSSSQEPAVEVEPRHEGRQENEVFSGFRPPDGDVDLFGDFDNDDFGNDDFGLDTDDLSMGGDLSMEEIDAQLGSMDDF